MKQQATATNSDMLELARESARLLDEKKAANTVILDLQEVNSFFCYFVITTGNSIIHCRSLARELERHLTGRHLRGVGRPDLESGWVVLDYGDLVIHIFTDEVRRFYQLEKLWNDATPVEF